MKTHLLMVNSNLPWSLKLIFEKSLFTMITTLGLPMFSLFSSSPAPESKECPPDQVIMVEHQLGAVCALVKDLLRLSDAVAVLKSVFNPNMCSRDQHDALIEVFEATLDLMGPDESDSDEDEPPPDAPTTVVQPATPTGEALVVAARNIMEQKEGEPIATVSRTANHISLRVTPAPLPTLPGKSK